MLNFKRLAPRSADTYRYTHNNEKITHQEADMINDGTFVEDQTSVPGEYITAQEVVQKLAAQHKHVNYMIGGDELNELVCYYTWSSDTVDPTSVYIPDLEMTVGDRKLLAYEITPENADVTSAEFSITNGSSIAHIEDSYIVADQQGTATYKVVVNGSIEDTATINVANKPEEFPDDAQHRWIRVQPESSQISVSGGTINVTGSYGLTGSYGTEKKVGDITDTIVIEPNSSQNPKSGSKTYYYNNNEFDIPTAEVTWTQPGREEIFTYQYHIYVGTSAQNIQDNAVSLVWQNDQYGESSKKSVYVRAYKDKVNESNQVVSTESVTYGIRGYISDGNQFSVDNNSGLIECYPLQENTDYSTSKEIGLQVFIEEHDTCFCNVSLIQDRKGVKIISGDAIMFTYNWDQGRDLDQATFVNLNHPSSDNNNYAGFKGTIIPEYKKILYFAGDNIGTGNEYAFIDFKSISEYLKEHGDEASSIDGKTIIESLTNDNGLIQIECDLYTNWYGQKEQEDINLSYSVYNKDSEDASVSYNDKQFILKGYTKTLDSSDQALCYAHGYANGFAVNRDVKKGYTLSAKFVYYFNSGVFSFKTNKDNVGIWNKGCVLTGDYKDISYSDVQFTNDGENVNLSLSLDSINASGYFDKETPLNVDFDIRTTNDRYFITLGSINFAINELPYKVNINKPLTEFKFADFGENQSVEVYPLMHIIDCIVNYDHCETLKFNDVQFKNNTVTIQKPST